MLPRMEVLSPPPARSRIRGADVMAVPTASEVLQATNLGVSDSDLTATCERCHVERLLSDCRIKDDGLIRWYWCQTCSHVLVEVESQQSIFAGAGCYEANGWVIRSIDLFAHIGGTKIRIGAKRRALAPSS